MGLVGAVDEQLFYRSLDKASMGIYRRVVSFGRPSPTTILEAGLLCGVEVDMGTRQLAATLLTLFLVGCGAAPTNTPAPLSNFDTQAPATGGDTTRTDETLPDEMDPDVTGDDTTSGEDTDDFDPNAEPSPEPSASPSDEPVVPIMDGGGSNGGGDQVIPLKNGIFKDWQATGIVAVDGQIYITASDRTGMSRRGSVLTQDAKGNWKDIGDTWLGLKHPLNNTVRGIAANSSGELVAVEASGKLGQITTAPKPKIKTVSTGQSGLLDVVCYSNSYYISTGTQIRKLSPDLTTSEALAVNLSLTGGMGIDKGGNFYSVATGQIVKVTPDGTKSVAIDNVMNAVDVAVAKDGRLVVLLTDGIAVYSATGEKLKDIGAGQVGTGSSIYVDSTNTIYVADTGKNRKTSQILTFGL
jgi:hypothetical protein